MKNEIDKFKQIDNISYIKEQIGSNPWFIAYKNLGEAGAFYSVFIENERVPQSMLEPTWDLHTDEGFPSCTKKYGNLKADEPQVTYYQFGQKGIQPLVYIRSFNDIKPSYIEISEEFRLYHNLYFDNRNNKYIKIDNNGNEEDAIIIDTDNTVKIKLKFIKQFLAIKNMSLLSLFELDYRSKNTLSELGLDKTYITKTENDTVYNYSYTDFDFMTDNKKSFSRIIGKKLIKGYPLEKCGIWPFTENEVEEFDEFIVEQDEYGDDITYTSNPDKLADYFGKNPSAPYYQTPVFFKREVLNKYYNEPNKYSIRDGYLSCGNLWGLRLDNDNKDYISVFLGDLGRYLNHKERLYWKSFNIAPDGAKISKTCLKRSFFAEFCDPQCSDLKFKQVFQSFNTAWKEKYSWNLFLPLSKDDEYHYSVLHIPSNNQSEFDEQVRGLVKMVIDSLNEQKLKEKLNNEEEIKGSISNLECFIRAKSIENFEMHIDFLRKLQNLRSSAVAHRKGENYIKIAKYFGLGENSYTDVFANILEKTINFLEFMNKNFLE